VPLIISTGWVHLSRLKDRLELVFDIEVSGRQVIEVVQFLVAQLVPGVIHVHYFLLNSSEDSTQLRREYLDLL
jgi:hypothetical protein